MALACPDSTSLVDSELTQLFGNGQTVSLLPATTIPSSDRDAEGRLTTSAVDAIVLQLTNTGIVPKATQNREEVLVQKQTEFLKNVQREYCFYYSRYKYALTKLLEAIQKAGPTTMSDKQKVVDNYLSFTKSLNQRLNDLIQITNAITTQMLWSSTSMSAEIQQVQQTLQAQQDKLAHQQKALSSGDASKKLSRDMVRYTEEKARYTDNLLTLYSALNIVALGILVYVYKSTSE